MLGVVFGLKKYRQHLLGRKILVRTDHAALTYLKRTPEPIGQQGRWLDLIAEFDIERIEHRPGRVYSNSNALSRRPCEREEEEPCQQCLRGTTVGRAFDRSTSKDSDENGLDPDYTPEGSVYSQSDPDSEDEYIEERAGRARDKPVSPAKPGEGAMVPVTAVKQEPMSGEDPHWTSSSDAVAVSGQPLGKEAQHWSSIMGGVELSNVGAAVEVSSWASVDQPSSIAPRWSSIMEEVELPNAGAVVEVPNWASEVPLLGTAPRLERMNEWLVRPQRGQT